MGAELFHEVGQTDITKLIVTLRNFANVPKCFKFDAFLLPCSSEVPQRTNVNIQIQKSSTVYV
jgi:hypothetical protein